MLRCDNKNTPTPPQAINNDRSLNIMLFQKPKMVQVIRVSVEFLILLIMNNESYFNHPCMINSHLRTLSLLIRVFLLL